MQNTPASTGALASVSNPVATPRGGLSKRLFFGAFAVMGLFVLWNNERFFLNAEAPEWNRLNPVRWHLVPHGLGGGVALVLGAIQFSSRVRRQHPRIHRASGRLYILGTFIAAPMAVSIALTISPWFLVPFTILQAITWALADGGSGGAWSRVETGSRPDGAGTRDRHVARAASTP